MQCIACSSSIMVYAILPPWSMHGMGEFLNVGSKLRALHNIPTPKLPKTGVTTDKVLAYLPFLWLVVPGYFTRLVRLCKLVVCPEHRAWWCVRSIELFIVRSRF